MLRSAIRNKFRVENPEVTARAVSDATLNSLMETANLEICIATRCITTLESEVIDCVVGQKSYNLEAEIANFYDIDNFPGGGVYYNDVPLTESTPGQMNAKSSSWKTRANGTPKFYWRRNKYLYLDRGPDSASVDLKVDCVLIPDAFDSDSEEPFNGLQHLQPFCTGIVKYLQWVTKAAIGKQNEEAKAMKDFEAYTQWMKKSISGYKYGPISFTPKR